LNTIEKGKNRGGTHKDELACGGKKNKGRKIGDKRPFRVYRKGGANQARLQKKEGNPRDIVRVCEPTTAD